MSRNAFIEVTPPPGRGVRWVSEDDFTLTGRSRAGAGSVVVRARPGWRLTRPRDGVMSLSPGQRAAYAVQGDLGEDGGGGDGHECDSREEVVTNCTPARLSMGSLTAKAGGILLPPEVTSVPVSLGAGVSVDSEGQHEIVTTVIPCTVCGEPPAGVTRSTVTTTPTQFLWEWSAGPTNGSEVGGAAFSKSVDIGSPARHPVSFSATATNVPPCCACSASAATNVLVAKLETETEATSPSDRMRKTIGVCEEVILSVSPAGVNVLLWELQGGGTLSYHSGPLNLYAASDTGGDASISVTLEDGLTGCVDFSIIEPIGILMENKSLGSLYGDPTVQKEWMALHYQASIYLMPDTVSFYRLRINEGASSATPTGYFIKPPYSGPTPDHESNGPHSMQDMVVSGKGTACQIVDNIGGYVVFMDSPYNSGDFFWELDWTWEGSGGTGGEKPLERVKQNFHVEIINDDFLFTITKDHSGYTISRKTGETYPATP